MNLGRVQQQPPSRRSAAVLGRLDSLPANAAILDASGRIAGVNRRWRQFGQQNGLRVPHSGIGSDYLQFCGSGEPNLRAFTRKLKGLLAGRLDLLTYIYPCHSPTQQRWFCLIGFPLSLDKPRGVALLHVEFTAMLPRPIGSQKGRAEGQPTNQIGLISSLDAISGAVERSVSETLSSQLNEMMSGRRQKSAADAGREMSIVRTRLTKRQMQVLRLLGEGKTNMEMASLLFVSPNTIKLHVSAILKRLQIRSRTQAALLSSNLKTRIGAI